VTIPAVITEVFDEAYEVEKCARHGRFLFFPNDFVLFYASGSFLKLPQPFSDEVTADQ
jgi:hypothetical protein